MITIHNLRNEKPNQRCDFRVDRESCLGNPYYMASETYRNKVCDQYEEWFNKVLTSTDEVSTKVQSELRFLLGIYKRTGTLRLFCWCAPKRCHAETIKKWLERN